VRLPPTVPADDHAITAADPLLDDLRDALNKIGSAQALCALV
jgi:hypothetical protein